MPSKIELNLDVKRFNGRLRDFIDRNERQIDRIVFEVAVNVLADIQQGWPVDSGVSRAAWNGPVRGQSARSWRLVNSTPYASVIEFGGYKGVGPKTVDLAGITLPGDIRVGGGIFPSQRPQAPVRRALSKNRNEMTDRISRAIDTTWGR